MARSDPQEPLGNPTDLEGYVDWFNRKHSFARAVIKQSVDKETVETKRYMELVTHKSEG